MDRAVDRAPAIIVAVLFLICVVGGCTVGRATAPGPGAVSTTALNAARQQTAQAIAQGKSAVTSQKTLIGSLSADQTQITALKRQLASAVQSSNYWEAQAQGKPPGG